ncbi:MAG: hypothetical protein U5J96_00205 [Ignavibacteriaceae bacterium]|nr:hypothetical protein [Ignavibacteriaceae bacterium]
MSDIAKQILQEMNKPLSERLKDQFVKYLEEIEQDKLIEVAKRIDWNPAVQLFELEYKRLWNNMTVPKSIKELKELNNEFANLVMASIRQRLFYSAYSYLKSLKEENRLNDENINSLMSDVFSAGMYDLFRVFDFQLTLTSLSKNDDPKVMIRKIQELKKRAEAGNKIADKKQLVNETKVFQMIEKELERRERVGQRWSIRAACDYFGSNELGYTQDSSHQSELDNFYQRYLAYQNKSKPNA